MTDKLELKSCHEVIDTVDVADVESIFHGKPIDPDILTVVMKDGKRLYCDEVCPVDSRQEEPVSKDLEEAADNCYFHNHACARESFIEGANWQKEQIIANTADAMIGLPYENKDGGYTHLIDVSRPLPVGNNKIAIIFKED